jgi:heme-degrading monooxygenase HmoA
MIRIVWEFRVRPGHEQEFERRYSGGGTWANFFRPDPAYQGTELVRDTEDPQRYLTFDHWTGLQNYERFRAAFHQQYEALDRQMEDLTTMERKVGAFTILGQALAWGPCPG